MSNESTSTAEPADEGASYPDQKWGKITLCVLIAMIAALAIHFIAFSVVFTGTTLPPTVYAFLGMVLFFVTGFASFSLFY